MSDLCEKKEITGDETKNGMVSHGIRGSVVNLLLVKVNADSSVTMLTGHRDPLSLKNYQNLHGHAGKK